MLKSSSRDPGSFITFAQGTNFLFCCGYTWIVTLFISKTAELPSFSELMLTFLVCSNEFWVMTWSSSDLVRLLSGNICRWTSASPLYTDSINIKFVRICFSLLSPLAGKLLIMLKSSCFAVLWIVTWLHLSDSLSSLQRSFLQHEVTLPFASDSFSWPTWLKAE